MGLYPKTKQSKTPKISAIQRIKTLPKTNGTVLNDGPNGYDNDYDQEILNYDEVQGRDAKTGGDTLSTF